ncbi:iojap family protein [[Clostridium] cellulosi]|uniref:Ribosomal silencing factor RsfS n=1 Tax=[Clostridium] cellulosi TaxID=29343 RepID=A0A078KR62_9FIRM|nr:iojap family protein [[Clostridium] cellulosi]
MIFKEAVFLTGKEILKEAVKILNGRKAEDIKAIDIAGISILADYFLIASGSSTTQVRALAEELEFKLSEIGVEPLRVEGMQSSTWIILDYGSVVIHIFHRDTRSFYNLERLWADGREVELSKVADGGSAGAQ